jgi:hypothetical protein
MENGAPAFVTALGQGDSARSWRAGLPRGAGQQRAGECRADRELRYPPPDVQGLVADPTATRSSSGPPWSTGAGRSLSAGGAAPREWRPLLSSLAAARRPAGGFDCRQ